MVIYLLMELIQYYIAVTGSSMTYRISSSIEHVYD